MGYEITFRDRTSELIGGADTFAHDKSMTTFYRTGNARQTVDCWSVPVACIRTDEILMIRCSVACDVLADDEVSIGVTESTQETATVHHLVSA